MKHSPLLSTSCFDQSALPMVTVAAAVGSVFLAALVLNSLGPILLLLGLAIGGGLAWSLVECRGTDRGGLPAGPSIAGTAPALPPVAQEIIAGVQAVAAHPDTVFRDLMASRLAQWATQMRDWSQGRVIFTDTEVWRTAYERVLTAPDTTEYRSVAWLKSEHYWQDRPGRQGMRLNFDLLDHGVRIERILILGWNVWPPESRLPREPVRRWIEDQHYRGVAVRLLRENDLVGEPDLLRDFGIYCDRAVGELHLDGDSRTVSFTLSFDTAAVAIAREQWERLTLYARPYEELIDRPPLR